MSATGSRTELGRIGKALQTLDTGATPLQTQTARWVRVLAAAAPERGDAASGREHRLLTALALVGSGEETLEVDVVRLRFFALGEGELERYLDTGEWRGCAGGYRIEGRGQALVAELERARTSVQGLPMLRVVRMLRARGVPLL